MTHSYFPAFIVTDEKGSPYTLQICPFVVDTGKAVAKFGRKNSCIVIDDINMRFIPDCEINFF